MNRNCLLWANWSIFIFIQVKWYLNGKDIYSGVTVEGDDSFSRITVKNMSSQTAGKYKVVAENKVGSAEAEFTVVVKGQWKVQDSSNVWVLWHSLHGTWDLLLASTATELLDIWFPLYTRSPFTAWPEQLGFERTRPTMLIQVIGSCGFTFEQ